MFIVQPPLFSSGGQSQRSIGAFRGGAVTKYNFFIRYLIYLVKLQKESLLIKIQYSFKIANMNNRGGC